MPTSRVKGPSTKPALAIAFRFSCYYYRGAGYNALLMTPPACAVAARVGGIGARPRCWSSRTCTAPRSTAALLLLVCLWWEAFAAFFRDGRFGGGVETAVMVVNAGLLSACTFGCHSSASPGRRAAR